MTRKGQPSVVVVALPFAYQDGMDKYNGIMRFLRETETDWELRIVRDTLDADQFRKSMSRRRIRRSRMALVMPVRRGG